MDVALQPLKLIHRRSSQGVVQLSQRVLSQLQTKNQIFLVDILVIPGTLIF